MSSECSNHLMSNNLMTGYLRTIHILDDMTGHKCKTIHATVLLIGPGMLFTNENTVSFPQLDELLAICDEKSRIDAVDSSDYVIKELQIKGSFMRGIDPNHLKLGAFLNKPNDAISNLTDTTFNLSKYTEFLSKSLESKLKENTLSKTRSFKWDPEIDDPTDLKTQERYSHIIATYSCFLYSENDDLTGTAIKLIKLLKNRGVLYIDAPSYKRIFCGNGEERLVTYSKLEKETGSEFALDTIGAPIKASFVESERSTLIASMGFHHINNAKDHDPKNISYVTVNTSSIIKITRFIRSP